MTSSSERRESAYFPSATARGFSVAGLVMVVLFLTVVAGSLFPIQLLEPAWQLRVGSALINSSPMPLTGLVLLHLASSLDLRDPQLSARRQLAARLAIPVSLGFLLLFPLLTTAALRQQSEQVTDRTGRVQRATTQLEAIRQAVKNATTVDDLKEKLTALQGPQLNEAERSLPLPVLRSRINTALDRVATQIDRQRPTPTAVNPWSLLPDILRSAVASVALFLGLRPSRGGPIPRCHSWRNCRTAGSAASAAKPALAPPSAALPCPAMCLPAWPRMNKGKGKAAPRPVATRAKTSQSDREWRDPARGQCEKS
jgi:hypothetical protein